MILIITLNVGINGLNIRSIFSSSRPWNYIGWNPLFLWKKPCAQGLCWTFIEHLHLFCIRPPESMPNTNQRAINPKAYWCLLISISDKFHNFDQTWSVVINIDQHWSTICIDLESLDYRLYTLSYPPCWTAIPSLMTMTLWTAQCDMTDTVYRMWCMYSSLRWACSQSTTYTHKSCHSSSVISSSSVVQLYSTTSWLKVGDSKTSHSKENGRRWFFSQTLLPPLISLYKANGQFGKNFPIPVDTGFFFSMFPWNLFQILLRMGLWTFLASVYKTY